MKKILFVALAAVGMTACVQNEELAVSNSNAIKFDNVYVDNATKAAIDGSYTAAKGNLDHFNVWATIKNGSGETNIFEGEAVTKNGGAWSYDASHTQYWIPGNDYKFVGVVDGTVEVTDDACKMPVTIATDLKEQKDVLYATHSRTYTASDIVSPVHFNFEHLLSKVKFTVKNVVSTSLSGYTYTVESIQILNADEAGVYTIENGTWEAEGTYAAQFGAVATLAYGQQDESNYERLVLPQTKKSLEIKVNYTLHKDAWYQEYEQNLTAVLDIVKGKAYNFILTLGNPGAPIEFTADVLDWEEENFDVPSVLVGEKGFHSFAEAFEYALTVDNATIKLIENVTLEEVLQVPAGKSITLDLNGNTITGTDTTSTNFSLIDNRGNLTVVGPGKLEAKATVNSGWNRYSAVLANNPGGNLYVGEGVIILHHGGTDMAYGIDNLTNGKNTSAVTTIEGATVKSTYRAVRQFLNGVEATNELYVKAGTLLEGANKSIFFHDPSKNANTGKLVVEAGAQLKGDVYLFVTAGSTEWPVEVSIASSALVEGSKVTSGNVPAQYEVVEENGTWVVKELEGTIVKTVEELKSALSNAEIPSIVLAGGETFEGTFLVGRNVTVSSSASNKATLKGRVNVVNASVLFNNVKFDRNETDSNAAWNTAYGSSNCLQYKAVVMIYGDATRSIKFEGCEFYNSKGTHKSSITNLSCDLSLNNCYLQGTSSSIYSQANLSVTNSTIDYTGTNNVVLSINGCGNNGGKVIFTGNKVVNEVFALGQFLSTVGFGNGTYYFDIQNNEGTFTNYLFNTGKVANKEFAAGSLTF